MLSLELSLKLRHRTTMELELTGGLTSLSVFPKTEARLLGDTRYQKALRFIGSRARMANYHSMMDFLFCESFPEWKLKCRLFYEGNGPQLIDDPDIVDEQILAYDEALCLILHGCLFLLNRKERLQWDQLVEAAMETIREAA